MPTRIPYVAVDEAKRALAGGRAAAKQGTADGSSRALILWFTARTGSNLLIDVKGRKHAGTTGRAFQNWVTRDDVSMSLAKWAEIFGEGFEPTFAFLFWCDRQPPDALFLDVFQFAERWYAVLAVTLADYREHMRDRSAKWDTVSVPAADFDRIARPMGEMMTGTKPDRGSSAALWDRP